MGTPEDVAAENYFAPPEEVKSKMKISKAIENLEEIKSDLTEHLDDDDDTSIQLGIEALKRYKVIRANFGKLRGDQLPGETTE